MKGMGKKFLCSTLVTALVLSTTLDNAPLQLVNASTRNHILAQKSKEQVIGVEQVNAASINENGLVENIKDGCVLHAWSWPYATVKERISEIAKAGYTAVQVSPVQPNKDSPVKDLSEWWKFYQPTDFSIGNYLGDKGSFTALCEEAEKYGVKIIVDVVANHLANNAGRDDGKFNNASTRHSAIPDWLKNNDDYWHINDFGGSDDNNRYQMTRGPIGMPDLNTANEELQKYILKFLNDAQDCGADGFRFDAAKHIETPDDGDFASQFWPTIVNGTKAKDKNVFLYGEILNTAGKGEVADMNKYTKYIRVTNNKYGQNLIGASANRNAEAAKNMGNNIFGSDPNNWIIWVESHDTFAGEYGDMTDSKSDEDVIVGWLACAARANAVPLFFARPEGGSRQGKTWKNSNALGADRGIWKDKRVVAVNKFHNYFAGTNEYASTAADNKVLVIERGTEGVALINFGDGEATVNTKMYKVVDGTYKDQLSGNSVTISGGNINAKVPSRSVAVIYNPTDTPKVTTAPTATPKVTTVPTDTPKVTTAPTATSKATTAPTATPAPKVTTEPTGVSVTSSLEDGSSFKTETQEITLTLLNATSGTYSVDDGPKKTFTKPTKVIIGQGKIADTDIKVKVTATDGKETKTTTFTYKKVFDKTAANNVKKTSVVEVLNDVFEVVAEVAQVNEGGAPTSSYYATNPNGQKGANKTVKTASDFTEDMIIAQGVANDDPAAFRGTHEAPKFDSYAMYGAWDAENLYIGVQYTNVIDVIDPAQSAPQTGRGKPNGADADIPQMLVFDTGTGDYTDGTANDVKQKTAWDVKVKFAGATKVDKIFMYSPKEGIVNQALFSVKDGIVDYDTVVKSGYNMPAIPGVTTVFEDGFFGTKMYGINGNGYAGYKPEDVNDASADWVDFMTTSHSTTHDTFGIVTIPLSLLGVSAADIESKGIGVMAISTYGESGMGSLPMDMTMLDAATEPYSEDNSTSHEKEDEDTVTVALARLGAGEIPVNPTSKPITTTTAPAKTEEPKVSTEPTKTEEPKVSTAPTKTEEPKVSTAPTKTEEPTEGNLTVNFGADRSSPQLDTTELTLKAIGYNGTEPYTYEFLVDGEVVQKASQTATYTWKPTAGTHKIKVVMTDKNGAVVSSEKEYVIETNGVVTETEKPVKTTDPTTTPVVTKVPSTQKPDETKAPTQTGQPSTAAPEKIKSLFLRITVSKVSPQTAGTKIKIKAAATGGKKSYKYTFIAIDAKGNVKTLAVNQKKSYINWKPTKTGSYTLQVQVKDSNGDRVVKNKSYKIVAKKLAVTSFTTSKKTSAVNSKIKLTANAIAKKGTVKYKFLVKAPNAKSIKLLKGYSTKNTVSWKPTKAGKYKLYVVITDGTKKTITKTRSFTVTKK